MIPAPQYKVPALEKGLDILEALAADSVPQSLAELAAKLDRSSSELFRMLNCLEKRGYLFRDPVSGKYGLSLKLYALSHTHSPVEKLLQAAVSPMQSLTESVRESCHLSLLDRGSLLVVAQRESPEPIRISIEVGGRFDPLRTNSGRLLLATLPADERLDALQASSSWKELKPTARKRLLQQLESLARSTVAEANSETIDGVQDLAIRVGHSTSGFSAALAVTRLKAKNRPKSDAQLIAAITATARQIDTNLGLR